MLPARRRPVLFATLFALSAPLAAAAQPAPPVAGTAPGDPAGTAPGERIGLELNRLEPRPDLAPPGCRAWMVLRNPADAALDPLRLDLVLFGRDGVIARRLVLDVGPLPPAKTTVRVFDLAGLPCDAVGAVLLNDLPACGAPGEAGACLPRVSTESRVAGVRFDR